MKRVTDILGSKSERTVQTISPAASVLDAIKRMAERNIGALVVMEDEKMLGIVTERDHARKVILEGRSSKDTPVREIMTAPAVCVRPDQTNEECMELMTGKRVRHLPVVDDGKLIGLVSIGDLVKDIISEQKQTIEQLERYIMGQRG
jgi:CBS domain-containing protein